MSDFDRNAAARYGAGVARADQRAIDQGLRSYMLSVYNYMAIALAVTGLVAVGTFALAVSNPAVAQAIYLSPLKWVIMLAPLGMVFLISARVGSMSLGGLQASFWIFAALMGLSLSSILIVFTGESVARVFFITAATFGALSLYGYTTKRDLTAIGSFLFMGLVGLIIASLVNIFLGSTMMQFIISVVGVIVFAGLTAYDTQNIKSMYFAGDGQLVAGRKAIMGALQLYLDFINLFMMLVQLLGDRR